jgi:hypothetical protein
MRLSLDCLLFVKTKAPVEPRELVRRICEDAKLVSDKKQRKSRFLNRLTPMTTIGRATVQGVEEVAKTVLSEHFQLAGVDDKDHQDGDDSVTKLFSHQPRFCSLFMIYGHSHTHALDSMRSVSLREHTVPSSVMT